MKNRLGKLFAGAILFGVLCVANAGSRAIPSLEGKPATQPSLLLTTFVESQTYCRNVDGGQNTLALELRLQFFNRGTDPIILYKGSNIIFRETVSGNLVDAQAGRYLFDLDLSVLKNGVPEIAKDDVPGSEFVILAVGESFETKAIVPATIFLKTEGVEDFGVVFGPGKYFLRVGVATNPFSQLIAQDLRTRWRNSGQLWTDALLSEPMPFEISKTAIPLKCEE